MDDLSRQLHAEVPPAPALYMAAIRARSHVLRRRRRAAAGVTSAAVLIAAVAGGVALAGSVSPTDVVLTPATRPATTQPPVTSTLHLLFGAECDDLAGIDRVVPGGDTGPTTVLREEFKGPLPGDSAEARSSFGPTTEGALRSVHIANGIAYVDLYGSFRKALQVGPREGCGELDQAAVTLQQAFGVAPVYFAFDGDPRALVEAGGGICPTTIEPGGPCDPEPFRDPSATASPALGEGIKAPPPSRLDRTDEFGTVARVSPDGLTVQVNRVDMLGGAEGEAAARARGQDYSADYFLVDDNPLLRTYRVAPDAVVWASIRLARVVAPTRVPLSTWIDAVTTPPDVQQDTLFHFQVQDGVIVGIEEQYRP